MIILVHLYRFGGAALDSAFGFLAGTDLQEMTTYGFQRGPLI